MSAISNAYDQLKMAVMDNVIAKEQAVGLSYTPTEQGRGVGIAKWQIFSPYFKTDPDSSWEDYRKFTITAYGRRTEALEEIKKIAKEKYGITEWARNRVGDYVPAIVNKTYPLPKRKKTVKA